MSNFLTFVEQTKVTHKPKPGYSIIFGQATPWLAFVFKEIEIKNSLGEVSTTSTFIRTVEAKDEGHFKSILINYVERR